MRSERTHVLLDLDGTLSDSEPGILRSLQWAFEKEGFPIPTKEQVRSVIGPPFEIGLPRIGIPQNDLERVVDRVEQRLTDRLLGVGQAGERFGRVDHAGAIGRQLFEPKVVAVMKQQWWRLPVDVEHEASEEQGAAHALDSGEAWALDVPPLDCIPIYHVINFTASASKARTCHSAF